MFAQSQQGNGRTLLYITLDGGCDWLQCFDVPFSQNSYYTVRPTIAIPQGNVLVTEAGRGFHPALGVQADGAWNTTFRNLHQLFQDGDVAVIGQTGRSNATGSHETEQQFMSSGGLQGGGWIGRVIDKVNPSTVSVLIRLPLAPLLISPPPEQ